MAFYSEKTPKGEKQESSPFLHYYPNSLPRQKRQENYLQIASIDPALKNFALRIERRFDDGEVMPLVFDKVSIDKNEVLDKTVICSTYNNLTIFLEKYKEFFIECHIILIERQLSVNYKSTRVAQHTISYLSFIVKDSSFLTDIIEISPTIKGKMLEGGTNLSKKGLKEWAVTKAREILSERRDNWSIEVMKSFNKKQDDLADTVCQIEAALIYWKKFGGPCAYLL